jgi:RHS repeat-associated protein
MINIYNNKLVKVLSVVLTLVFLCQTSNLWAYASKKTLPRLLTVEEMKKIKGGCYSSSEGGATESQTCEGEGECDEKKTYYKCPGDPTDCCKASPVSLSSGEMVQSSTDTYVSTRGDYPLELTRTYGNQSTTSTEFGYGWRSSLYGHYLDEQVNGDVKYYQALGASETYTKNDGGYTSPTGSIWTLTKNGDNDFTMASNQGGEKRFSSVDGSGNIHLTYLKDNNSNQTDFSYDGSGRLTKVTGPGGRPISLCYDGSGRVTRLTDPAGNAVTYEYTQNPTSNQWNLTKVVDRGGYTVTYAYDGADNLTKITDKRGNSLTFKYDASDRCTGDSVHTYEYNTSLNRVYKINKNGYTTTYYYTEFDAIDQKVDAYGNTEDYIYYTDPSSEGDYLKLRYLIDENGYTISYAYDSNGNMTIEEDARGNEIKYYYDANNNMTMEVDKRGFTTTYYYDANHNLTKETDPRSTNTTCLYDSYGQTTALIDANGFTTSYYYNSYGNLTRETDPPSHNTYYSYDVLGNQTKMIDAESHTTGFYYDKLGRLTKETDANSNSISYYYDGNGNRTRIVDKNSKTIDLFYDTYNRITRIEDPLDNAKNYLYDLVGSITVFVNSESKTTTYNYDNLNRVTKITDPNGKSISATYDKVGKRTSIIDALSHVIVYKFDEVYNRSQLIDATTEGTTNYYYDKNNNLTSVVDTKGNTTDYYYDKLNRLTREEDPLNNAATLVYDPFGNLTSKTDNNGNTTAYSFDKANRMTETVYSESTTASFSYDDVGYLTRMIDSTGTTDFTYNNIYLLTQMTYPGAKTVKYLYDDGGRRTGLVDPDNGTALYTYDDANRPTRVINPQGQTTTFSYDAAGYRTLATLASGTTASYLFDNGGRLTSLSNKKSDSTVISSFDYTFDDANKITKVIHSNGDTVDYSYDVLNQLTKELKKNSSGSTLYAHTYFYDDVGNRTSYNIAEKFSDNFNRSDSSSLGDDWTEANGNWEISSNRLSIPDASTDAVCIWTGGDQSEPTVEVIMNAVTAGQAKRSAVVLSYQSTTDFYYAGAAPHGDNWVVGRCQGGTWTDGDTYSETINKNQDYELRAEVSGSTITLKVKENGEWVEKVSYDFGTLPDGDVGVTVEQSHTNFDDFGVGGDNTTYLYNELNHLTKSTKDGTTTTTYSYDLNGNLTKKIAGTNTSTYEYDAENMMTKVTAPSATVSYTYSNGLRVKRVKGDATTKYYYDGIKVLMERNTSTIATYTLDPIRPIGHIISSRRGTSDYYYHYNHLGNVKNLTDAEESVIVSYTHEAFGNILSGSSANNTYGLTTKEWDTDPDLYYFAARWYDPVVGRFISRDPVPSINLYNYVRNNPLNLVDLFGKYVELPQIIIEYEISEWKEVSKGRPFACKSLPKCHPMRFFFGYTRKCKQMIIYNEYIYKVTVSIQVVYNVAIVIRTKEFLRMGESKKKTKIVYLK